MEYKVIKQHKGNYPDPIVIKKGETVILRKKSNYWEWPNWVFCESQKTKKAGWVPEQVLLIQGNLGEVKESYNARELDVEIGEMVYLLRELNGWGWCCNKKGLEGWVPLSCLEQKPDRSLEGEKKF